MANIISRLKLESGEFDSKIKRAGQELLAYSEHCKKMGLEMGYANRDAKEFAKQLGSMATVSTTARGKINELSEAFVNAKVMYKNMTDEEKKGEFGRNLAASLDQLKVRLNDAKKDLADVTKELNGGGGKFGEFGNVLDTLGSKLGVTGNLTELLTSKTALLTGAVGAGIAVVTKSAEAWASYNAELAKQDQITQVTTGLEGDDADRMTDTIRALVDTYDIDFREAVNAANTLMTQFGKNGDEALGLIKDGLRGMIRGDGPKLLSMIQQYAPAFRDAGISASQLIAIIHNSEGGIFTDQNMNAIVMGIKNIRLMTDATSQSLAKMGIDGKKMSEQLNNGTLTIFDALKQVSRQLQTVDSNSKTAGEVMQQVFGRQGVTAGTNLAKAIEILNTDLEKTKLQTGDVGDSLKDLQDANEKLNTAIRDCFEYDGWDTMATGIRSKLVTALAAVVEQLSNIKSLLTGMPMPGEKRQANTDRKSDMNRRLDEMKTGGYSQIRNRVNEAYYENQISQRQNAVDTWNKWRSQGHGGVTPEQIAKVRKQFGTNTKAINDEIKEWKKTRDEYRKGAKEILDNAKKDEVKVPNPGKLNPNPHRTGGNTTTPKPEDTNYAADSIMAQEKLVAKLTDQYKRAGAAVKDGIKKQLDEANETLKEMKTGPDLNKLFPDRPVTSSNSKSFGEQLVSDMVADLGNAIQDEDMENLRTLMEAKIKNGLEDINIDTEWIHDVLFEQGGDIPDEFWLDLQSQINEGLKKIGKKPIVLPLKSVLNEQNLNAKIAEIKKNLSGLTIGSKEWIDLKGLEADALAFSNMLQTAIKNGMDVTSLNPEYFWKNVFGDHEQAKAVLQDMLDKINAYAQEKGIDPIKVNFTTGEIQGKTKEESNKFADEFSKFAGEFVGGLSSVSSGLSKLGVELPEGVGKVLNVLQGVTEVINGVNSIIQSTQVGAIVANTAAVTANTAALGGASVTGAAGGAVGLAGLGYAGLAIGGLALVGSLFDLFHNGGIVHAAMGYTVPGNYGYDAVPAMLTSGELVLNRAQQGVLADALQSGGGNGNLRLETYVSGRDLRIVLNNESQGRLKGKYVTSNKR